MRNYFKETEVTLIPELLSQLAESAEVNVPTTPPERFKPITWEKARELEKQGVQFAPHSTSHLILSKQSKEMARKELQSSWEVLKDNLDNPLNVFCYPTGRVLDFGPREIDILKDNNFLGAVSTIPGYVSTTPDASNNLFKIPRFELPDNFTDFIQYCSWIEYAKHRQP